MQNMLRHVEKAIVLFLCGGGIYAAIEILWRGYTHWTMAVLGGLLFLVIGGLNNWFSWDMSLVFQGVVGGVIITIAEFAAGLILNIYLGLGVWDYSEMAGNVLGQICPQFTLVWMVLSVIAVIVDDWLRYRLFGEERPSYHLI